MFRFILLLSALAMGTATVAQEGPTWSLEKCIQYAIDNSLQVQQANLTQKQALLNKKQAVWSQAPTVDANLRHGVNFGRSVDLTTYQFNVQPTHLGSISLNANWLLYQGMQVRNTIKQTRIDVSAAEQDVLQAKNDVSLAVAQAYLSILLATENKGVLEEQANVTKAQLKQTARLIEGGVLAENSRYDLEAQIARDEERILVAQNTIDLAYVNLKVLMNMDVSEPLTIETVDNVPIPENEALATLDEVYEEALKNQPNVVAAQLRERSAELGINIARGALTPAIALYSSINTNFSSAFKIPTTPAIDTTFGVVTSTGQITHSYQRTFTDPKPVSYFKQLGGNLSGNIGINISVPIFNGLRNRINIERAELATRIAKLGTEQIKNTLKANIASALTDVRAAQKRLVAASKSIRAIRLSVNNTRRRYDLGVVNSFELTSVQNTLIAAESSVLQAKYDYLFKLKILDYYRGRPIELR